MNKGLFISFEGADGTGKSTQVRLLTEYLRSEGYDVLLTREPGGTVISERIRNIILDPSTPEMDGHTEALLYAASRAQLVAEVLRPAIESGKIVICDRFMDSSIAYQGYARGLGQDTIRMINEFAVHGLQPDITFFMDLPPEKAMLRVESQGHKDRLEAEDMNFHDKVYQGFKELSRFYDKRYVRIDASESIEEISEKIRQYFRDYVERRDRA
jgi:dTMP kinase